MSLDLKKYIDIIEDFPKEGISFKDVSPLLGKGLGATCTTDLICNEGKESCGLINKLLETK